MPDLATRTDHEDEVALLILLYLEQIEVTIRNGGTPDWLGWTANLSRELTALLAATFVEAAEQLVGEHDGWTNDADDRASQWASQRANWIAGSMATTTRDAAYEGMPDDWHFSGTRAESVAITETTAAISEGEHYGAAELAALAIMLIPVWVTEEDERVCFPAGTLVSAMQGDVPIEEMKVGMHVLTREGYKKVIARSVKEHEGRFVVIAAGDSVVVATEDHRFWTSEKGWLAGREMKAGYTLQSVGNQQVEVSAVINLRLRDSDDVKAAIDKVLGLPCVSGLVPMPVCSVDFNGDHLVGNQKVDAVPANATLLNCINPNGVQRHPDGGFNQCFGLALSVARKAAKLPVFIAREVSKSLSAGFAICKCWWTPTLLRAKVAIESLFSRELLPASLAVHVLSVATTASKSTNRVSVGYRGFDGEVKSAHLAGLSGVGRAFFATFPRAALLVAGLCSRWNDVEVEPTDVAGPDDARPLALLRSGLEMLVSRRHEALYHAPCANGILVYDIQVEECPEFFANGVLVHNCPICDPLNRQRQNVWQGLFPTGPPGHVNCRCRMEWVRV